MLDPVSHKGHVSFVEGRELFPTEVRDISIVTPDSENVIFWSGMSEKQAQAVESRLAEKKLFVHPTSSLTYAIDGALTFMPVAKSLRKYKAPHWFPVTLHHQDYSEKG
ncbi:MAG: hypothetical protein KDK03_14490 [Rhodobacteraceae bacterium]|nr:hypothetical protein [Paracoccaceae bacterium]